MSTGQQFGHTQKGATGPPASRRGKDPLSRSQRLVLAYLVRAGGQLPGYHMRESAAYSATQTTRDSLQRRGFIDVERNHPLRGMDGQTVKVDSAQITRAGLDALDWDNGGHPGWPRQSMLAAAEAAARAEHEVRHPTPRDYRDEFSYLFRGETLDGLISNYGDTVEMDFCIDLHERNFGVSFTLEQAQHLSGTIAAAWSAARTHHNTQEGTP